MGFVFTTTLVWHMFSVSFTSIQPWFYKTWFTEDVEGFHNHCLHIWTVFFPWLFLWFPLHASIHAITSHLLHSRVNIWSGRRFLSEFDTKGQILEKKKKRLSQINPEAVETAQGELWWLNFSPTGSRAKRCGESSVPSKTNRSSKTQRGQTKT